MCDTFLCIHVYYYALNYISVIVIVIMILMWLWYLCDSDVNVIFMWYVTCVCVLSTWIIYMSCHLVMLICLASAFYSDSNELYFLYSCLFHIYWVHHVGLGHISMSNSFALIVKSLYEPSMLKTSLILRTRGCVVINHQTGGDWKHLGP